MDLIFLLVMVLFAILFGICIGWYACNRRYEREIIRTMCFDKLLLAEKLSEEEKIQLAKVGTGE